MSALNLEIIVLESGFCWCRKKIMYKTERDDLCSDSVIKIDNEGSNFILCTAARGYYEKVNSCKENLEVIILRLYIIF